MVNPAARESRYLAQALGVDEATARVWRMWSHLPEGWHAEALRRAIIGSVVSTYGGREEVKSLVKDLVPAVRCTRSGWVLWVSSWCAWPIAAAGWRGRARKGLAPARLSTAPSCG